MSSNMDTETSNECSVAGLDLFERLPIQTAIKQSSWNMYKPLSPVNSATSVIKIHYQGKSGVVLDLARTILRFKCKITKADGTDIAADKKVAACNYVLASAFQQVDAELNGRNVCSSNSSYPYRSFIEVQTSHNKMSQTNWLKAAGWTMNTMIPDPLSAVSDQNEGFTELIKNYAGSKNVTVAGPIHLDIFQQNRFLIPNVNVLLTFILSSHEFVINVSEDDTEKYKFLITEFDVHFLECLLSDAENMRLEARLLSQPALYPIVRVDVRNFQIGSGLTAFSEDNVFTGQLPRRLLIVLVRDDAFTGSYHKSPFNTFSTGKMNYLSLTVGGRQIPNQPMTPSIDLGEKSSYNDEYMWFQAGLGKLFENDDIGLTPAAWASYGRCIYAFDTQPHLPDDCVPPMEQGNVRINMRFTTATPTPLVMIVIGEFNNTIIIDRNRNVIHDF